MGVVAWAGDEGPQEPPHLHCILLLGRAQLQDVHRPRLGGRGPLRRLGRDCGGWCRSGGRPRRRGYGGGSWGGSNCSLLLRLRRLLISNLLLGGLLVIGCYLLLIL